MSDEGRVSGVEGRVLVISDQGSEVRCRVSGVAGDMNPRSKNCTRTPTRARPRSEAIGTGSKSRKV